MRNDYTITMASITGIFVGMFLVAIMIISLNLLAPDTTPHEPSCPPEISTNFNYTQPTTADEVDAPEIPENVSIPETVENL